MKKPKLLGIELIRGIATYAVVLVHSGDQTWGLPISSAAISFRLLFYFAVPFFLATAFYFMTAKLEAVYTWKFWSSKVERILVPYAMWSVIYLFSRAAVFFSQHKLDRIDKILNDPLSVIFFGGASYQLYFLPLLFSGTFTVLLSYLLKQINFKLLGWLMILAISILLYVTLESSGNEFRLGDTSTAFSSIASDLRIDLVQHPLLRLTFIMAAWIIKCLPYCMTAFLLHRYQWSQKIMKAGSEVIAGASIIFILSDTFGKQVLPAAVSELLVAFSLLILGIAVSKYLNSESVLDSLSRCLYSVGLCSFGIYLIHPFTMNILKPFLGKIFPSLLSSVSVFSMLTLSVPCFLLSWIIVSYIVRNKLAGKYLFGT